MTESLIFHSSFDSTRFTALHPGDYPNLAQAQVEAVISLLLGRSLVVNNTYAFDSRSVHNLLATVLETRDEVRNRTGTGESGRKRLDDARPFSLRWYGGPDFLACCAGQLTRLEPPERRFILSHWKAIDGNDPARVDLAEALTARDDQFPGSVAEYDTPAGPGEPGELARSFKTLLRLDEYASSPGGGSPSRVSSRDLLGYLTEFEAMDRDVLATMQRKRQDESGDALDLDTAIRLQKSISKVDHDDKKNRSWAHKKVEEAGGEDGADAFLLQQRQLVDTLYNSVLADSSGSDCELMSSVPRTVGSKPLQRANWLAVDLINTINPLGAEGPPLASGRDAAATPVAAEEMSALFETAGQDPDLQAAPLPQLFLAYWQLIADDDTWLAWQDSCDQLQLGLRRAQRRRSMGRQPDSYLTDSWLSHLDMLQDQLPHVRAEQGRLLAGLTLGEQDYLEVNQVEQPGTATYVESLASGQYIDRYLRGVMV
jgi:hypothetical protein